MSYSYNSIVNEGKNPCPTVNPFIVAEYLLLRQSTTKAGLPTYLSRDALNVARDNFGRAALNALRKPYKDLTLYKTGQVNGNRFEAHNRQCRWIESVADVGLADIGYADKLTSSIRHAGWYADEHGHTIYRGVILCVSGTRNYIIGYEDPENKGAALIEDGVYRFEPSGNHGERDAEHQREEFLSSLAYKADSFAQAFAEEERERDCARGECIIAKEAADEARSVCRELRESIKSADQSTAASLREEFCEAWDDYKQAMKDYAEKLSYAFRYYEITISDL